jgi:hypothetical protein
MNATGHAASGFLVGAATGHIISSPDQPGFWIWAGLVAGCSILPDADIRRSTVDELFGPFTRGIRWGQVTLIPGLWSFVRPFLGGHRARTHRIEGVILFLFAVWVASHWQASSAVLVVFGVGLAVRCGFLILTYLFDTRYRKRYWLPLLLVSLAGAWLFWQAGDPLPGWVPFAMAAGCAVHVAGDMVTDSGVKITYLSERPSRLLPEPLCFKAGGWVEHTLVIPPMLIATGLVMAYQAGYDPIGSVLTAMRGA